MRGILHAGPDNFDRYEFTLEWEDHNGRRAQRFRAKRDRYMDDVDEWIDEREEVPA